MSHDRRYRNDPLYLQLREGDIVRRKEVTGIASRLLLRRGRIAGAPYSEGKGIYYVDVLWEGSSRTESVFVSRLERVEELG